MNEQKHKKGVKVSVPAYKCFYAFKTKQSANNKKNNKAEKLEQLQRLSICKFIVLNLVLLYAGVYF